MMTDQHHSDEIPQTAEPVAAEILPSEAVDTSSLMKCYGLLALCVPLTFVPVGLVSGFALAGFVLATIWAYVLRRKAEPLFYNHGRWMTRTVWMSTAYFLLAMVLSATIVATNADNTAIADLGNVLKDGTKTPEDVRAMMEQFNRDNKNLLLTSTLVCYTPAVLFAVVRFVKGYTRAYKGQPMDSVKSWLI